MICVPAVRNTFLIIHPYRINAPKVFPARYFVVCIVIVVEKIAAGNLEFLAPKVREIDSERVCFTDPILLTNEKVIKKWLAFSKRFEQPVLQGTL